MQFMHIYKTLRTQFPPKTENGTYNLQRPSPLLFYDNIFITMFFFSKNNFSVRRLNPIFIFYFSITNMIQDGIFKRTFFNFSTFLIACKEKLNRNANTVYFFVILKNIYRYISIFYIFEIFLKCS